MTLGLVGQKLRLKGLEHTIADDQACAGKNFPVFNFEITASRPNARR